MNEAKISSGQLFCLLFVCSAGDLALLYRLAPSVSNAEWLCVGACALAVRLLLLVPLRLWGRGAHVPAGLHLLPAAWLLGFEAVFFVQFARLAQWLLADGPALPVPLLLMALCVVYGTLRGPESLARTAVILSVLLLLLALLFILSAAGQLRYARAALGPLPSLRCVLLLSLLLGAGAPELWICAEMRGDLLHPDSGARLWLWFSCASGGFFCLTAFIVGALLGPSRSLYLFPLQTAARLPANGFSGALSVLLDLFSVLFYAVKLIAITQAFRSALRSALRLHGRKGARR